MDFNKHDFRNEQDKYRINNTICNRYCRSNVIYITYIELLCNDLDKAILYQKQFDESNQSLDNSIYLVYAIFLKYMIYLDVHKNDTFCGK